MGVDKERLLRIQDNCAVIIDACNVLKLLNEPTVLGSTSKEVTYIIENQLELLCEIISDM